MGQTDVKGYEGNPGYDGPYHPSAELDPELKFVKAGDPEAQGALEADAYKQAVKFRKEREKQRDESLESWELEQGKTAVLRESDEYPDVTVPREYDSPIDVEEQVATAKARQKEIEKNDNVASDHTTTSGSGGSTASNPSSSTRSVGTGSTSTAKKTAPSKGSTTSNSSAPKKKTTPTVK